MQDQQLVGQIVQGCAELSRIPHITYRYNPREVVYQLDKVTLYHYHATQKKSSAKKANNTPVLVVFATINRPEILDLVPEKSFIRGLLDSGVDVYLLDWGYPSQDDHQVNISQYVTNYLNKCIDQIINKSQQKKIDLIGICQGGLLCLCHSLLFQKIRKLVLLSVPIHFHSKNDRVSHIMQQIDWRMHTQTKKNITGLWLTQFFLALKPFELIGKKYLHFMDQLDNRDKIEQFLLVEKWLYDAPDQPAAAFSEFMTELYQQNKLVKGEFKIDNQALDLTKVNIPLLNITATGDHIVPSEASRVLKDFVPKEYYSEYQFASGHIGLYISEKAGKKAGEYIAGWLAG